MKTSLTLHKDNDGYWLRFQVANDAEAAVGGRRTATVSLNIGGPLVASILREWAESQRERPDTVEVEK